MLLRGDGKGKSLELFNHFSANYHFLKQLERQYAAYSKLHEAVEAMQNEFAGGRQVSQMVQYFDEMMHKLSGPKVGSILDGTSPVLVNKKTTVTEATALMRKNHTTSVIIMNQASIAGIFTTKDVVLRVIAAGLNPKTCSVVRVMTPHPECASYTLSIAAALRKMHGK